MSHAESSVESGERHHLTLRFLDPALERAFDSQRSAAFVRQAAMATLTAAALWACVAILVARVVPEHTDSVAVLCAVGVLANLVARVAILRLRLMSHREIVAAALNAGSAFVVLALSLVVGFRQALAPGLIVIVIFAFFYVPMSVVYAAASVSTYLAAFTVLVVTRWADAAGVLDAFLVYAAAMVSGTAAAALESRTREVFFQRRVIAKQREDLEREKGKSDRLLLNVLPASIAARLREDHQSLAESFDDATVLFADLVGFTALSASRSATDIVGLLDGLFSRFDELAERFGVEKIKTIGDAYMVVGGLPERAPDHAERVADLGLAMLAALREYAGSTNLDLSLRIGIHSGPVVAGVIGKRKFSYDLWGDTVNTASRMESHGVPGRVHASDAVRERLRESFDFEERGPLSVKGKGEMRTHFLVGRGVDCRQPAPGRSSS